MELTLAQRDLVMWQFAAAHDWWTGRLLHIEFLSSYSNFAMRECVSPALHHRLDQLTTALSFAMRDRFEAESAPKKQRTEAPRTPTRPPRVAPPEAPLPVPPPVWEYDDHLLDPESWSVVVDYGLDAKAI